MYFKVYLQTQCLFAWCHWKIKRHQQKPDKRKLWPSTSLVYPWEQHLKVPYSPVLATVDEYKVLINPKTTAKRVVKMPEETGAFPSALVKQKLKLTIVIFGGKRGACKLKNSSKPWSAGVLWLVLCCRRDWCISQNQWGRKIMSIYWSNISSARKLKLCFQTGFPNGQWPQVYFQGCGKMV